MSKTTRIIISLLVVAVIALSFGFGYTYGRKTLPSLGEGLDIVGQASNIILTDYVDREQLDTEMLSRAAIKGMLESLDDPYASYLEAEHYGLALSSLEGEFDGIGAYVTVEDKQPTILAPIADSPADKAGIKAGDIILEINGESASDISLAEAVLKIRGPEGTAVKLLVLHEGESEPEEIEIIRTRIEVPSVRFEIKEDIAYIYITQFSERTGAEMDTVLKSLVEEDTRGIILDLRGNPGGLLETVIEVASYFLHDGTILKVVNSKGDVATLQVRNTSLTTDLPMVVLVDDTSASGSEVLAGALQDHGRATIAGTKTYGKGSVNILRQLDDGSAIYITNARWLTPDGRPIEGQGIEPDIEFELTGEEAILWAAGYLTSNE